MAEDLVGRETFALVLRAVGQKEWRVAAFDLDEIVQDQHVQDPRHIDRSHGPLLEHDREQRQ